LVRLPCHGFKGFAMIFTALPFIYKHIHALHPLGLKTLNP
jgi:hypothetical protein